LAEENKKKETGKTQEENPGEGKKETGTSVPVDKAGKEPKKAQKNGAAEAKKTGKEHQEAGSKKEDRLKDLEDTIAKLKEQYEKKEAELKDKFLRTAAEYDNYRKRTEKEKTEAYGRGMAAAIEKMLPVLDTLELAASADCENANYKKGVEMTVGMFKKALSDMGVTEIDALGKKFDPNLHSAIAQDDVEGTEEGTVTRVLQKGYKYEDRVIRYAQVAVQK
jgi:molecular chaperone GrpE